MRYNLPKRRPYEHPGRLFVARHGVPEFSDGIVEYANFLRNETRLGKYAPTRLRAIRWRFGAKLEPTALPPETPGFSDHELGLIFVNKDDPLPRQRFTEAHEFVELLYRACKESEDGSKAIFATHLQDKEKLCHKGAAALLMPQELYLHHLGNAGVSLEAASFLAGFFGASLTAAVHRMVDLSSVDCAMMLWHVPPELKQSLGERWEESAALNLNWAVYSPGIRHRPSKLIIDADSLIWQAYVMGGIHLGKEMLNFGRLSSEYLVEAKRVTLAGEQCMLLLIQSSKR